MRGTQKNINSMVLGYNIPKDKENLCLYNYLIFNYNCHPSQFRGSFDLP